jgi:hypothetical protein
MPLATDGLQGSLFPSSNSSPNPLFDYLSGFVPRKIKDSFRWYEYLSFNSTHIYSGLYKLADYSVTDVSYQTDSEQEKTRHKDLLEKVLKIKSILKAVSRDRLIYGNSFVSLYFPFVRNLVCKTCNSKRNIETVDYKFKWKDLTFRWTCKECHGINATGIDDLEDLKVPNSKRVNVIRWDPKLIDIDYNPLTGDSTIYYTIPKEVKEKIRAGNKHLLNTVPVGFLKAIKEDRLFKFDRGQVFHMKIDAPAGIDAQWGFSPLLATLKSFLYVAVLRKANEAIALDFAVPMRILHPAQSSANADPVTTINLSNWTEKTRENIRKWRRDPLHIMFAPVPLGITQMGGTAKLLLTATEIRDVEDNIITALGIPREFLYGGMTMTGSSVTLRMLENQLLTQTKDLEDLMQWISDKCATFLGWGKISVELLPFKLVDDVQQKNLMIQLNQTKPIISDTTVAEVLGYDLKKERDLRMQEALDEARFQMDVQKKISDLQNSLGNQARQQAGSAPPYNPMQIVQQADQLVQQLSGLDHGSKKSELDKLKSEDFVMYSVVSKRLEAFSQTQTADAKAQLNGKSQQPPSNGMPQ